MAATHGIGRERVQELIALVGLEEVAQKRAGQFSLGMGQRLGIAAALLGDPEVIVLDEPINGLDPEGIRWIRNLLKALAAEGRTVFLSSHLMSEMALTADHLIIIGQGRLIRDISLVDFVDESSANIVRVRSPQAAGLRDALLAPDVRVSSDEPSVLTIDGLTAQQVGHVAAVKGFELHELTTEKTSLEDAFMELTRDETEYRASTLPNPATLTEPAQRERIAA